MDPQSSPRSSDAKPQPVRLEDYRPPAFVVPHITITVRLGEDETEIEAEYPVERRGDADAPLILYRGTELAIDALSVDGTSITAEQLQQGDEAMALTIAGDRATIRMQGRVQPQTNTRLEGLFKSSGTFCTQCEPEGFRHIVAFPDRPDIMARYRVRIEAESKRYPVLLSNGNRVEAGTLPNGRHYAVWDDPFPKPSYLFALVGGDLACLSDQITTRSGRRVALNIYAAAADIARCDHAMAALKKSIAWDEAVFGLEYDLDIYNIVAVGDFNMGAMENKSLNIFNTKYVLADTDTATDIDFDNVERVIAHEYFHNWTGNRVTCRDWFQLSLKEGLTVFRDQQFAGDMASHAVRRINDVRSLRAFQFPEDAGPTAHPVRPASFIEINNFYTATVYDKGAEVIRMLHTLLGTDGFRAGMDCYFTRHDGQAVTCDDFVAAMADANDRDLTHFARWYAQAGTPELRISSRFDAGVLTLSCAQTTRPTPGQPDKQPLYLPIKLELLDRSGRPLACALPDAAERREDGILLHLTEAEATYRFTGLAERPVLSLLRGFSAPVNLTVDQSDEDKLFLLAHDSDPFARWEAGQQLAMDQLHRLIDRPDDAVDGRFVEACGTLLRDETTDRALIAEMLLLPPESVIAQSREVIDPAAIHDARRRVRVALATGLLDHWQRLVQDTAMPEGDPLAPAAKAARRLRNVALSYWVLAHEETGGNAAVRHYHHAGNMTDRMAALIAIADTDHAARGDLLGDFYQRFSDNALVIDKWFSVQAMAGRADALDTVKALTAHRDFSISNPNRFRSLIGAYAAGNPYGFHRADGAGYEFLAEQLLAVDRINPQLAARSFGPLSQWKRYEPARRAKMQQVVEHVLADQAISRDLHEMASRAMAAA